MINMSKEFKKVRKAVFPVGGLGTRFLPATKSLPKEMLPVASKPLIQYVFEEAQKAGIEQFIFITGRNKNAINNHFDHSYELQSVLNDKDKKTELSLTKDWLPSAGQVAFIRQQQPLGLGHAVWCARNFIQDEPFAVLLADEMLQSKDGFLKEMVECYNDTGGSIIALTEVEPYQTVNYGIIEVKERKGEIVRINNMVEKPDPKDAPSNLAITGRYILHSNIFKYLEKTTPGRNGEIQLTDAMNNMAKDTEFYGVKFTGPRFDCGNPLGFLEANIAYAFEEKNRDQIISMLKKYIVE
jgi:UTP--glucose-1-phosphate uridylyltransferase